MWCTTLNLFLAELYLSVGCPEGSLLGTLLFGFYHIPQGFASGKGEIEARIILLPSFPSPLIVTSTSYPFTTALLASGFLGNSSLPLKFLSYLKDCLVTPPKHFSRVRCVHFASPKWEEIKVPSLFSKRKADGKCSLS